MKHTQTWPAAARLIKLISSVSLLAALASCHDEPPIPEMTYLCGNEPLPEETPGAPRCGEGDPDLPPEPFNGGKDWPAVDPSCVLKA
jgi:hypothetical protein